MRMNGKPSGTTQHWLTSYDALTSSRTYRVGWPHLDTLNYIREQSGILFDPAIVKAFLLMMEN